MSHTTNCGCTDTQQTTYICGECAPNVPCDCPVLDLSTDCSLYTGDNIQCQNTNVVLKNTVLSVALKNIVDFFCLKLSEVANRFRIVNIGTGAKVYKQENLLGQKELRTITSSNTSITIVEGTSTIDLAVTTANPTASNVGTGAGVFKELSSNDYKFRKIKTENSGIGNTILKAQVENTNDISIISKTLLLESQGTGISLIKDLQSNTDDNKIRLSSLGSVNGTVNITKVGDLISIEIPTVSDIPSLIVNSDYTGTEELGTASKPFKTLQKALDAYVGNGASNKVPDLLGTIIKVQKDANVFTGSLSYAGLNIEIANGASLITNPSASNYVLDLDSDAVLPTNINYSMIPFTNTEIVSINITILEGGSLQAQKRLIKNRGNNNISGQGKIVYIRGNGYLINLAEVSVVSPSVKNLFSLNEDNQVGFVNGNATASVAVFCNISSYNSQVAYIGLNARYYSTQNLTQFGQLATPFNSNTVLIEINGGDFVGDSATIENEYNNAPTYSLITLISLKNGGLYLNKGATIGKVCENIFLNKDTGSTTTCQVILDNCNSTNLQTDAVFKSLMSSNLWNVRLTNCNFPFWGVDEAKVKLIPGSINTLASKVVETLPNYDSRAAAIVGGLFTGCKFINTGGVVSPTTGWIVDIVI
jgi:hypothetical protein